MPSEQGYRIWARRDQRRNLYVCVGGKNRRVFGFMNILLRAQKKVRKRCPCPEYRETWPMIASSR